jgi:hypothetical protein
MVCPWARLILTSYALVETYGSSVVVLLFSLD